MENIFGMPITTLLIGAGSIMAICLVVVCAIAWRNPVIARMALRNVPRRRAQSILIMVGLMLSTMIIGAALTTGDSLNTSFRSAAFESLSEVDQVIGYTGAEDADVSVSVTSPLIPEQLTGELEAQLAGDPNIDGFMPMLTIAAPVINSSAGLSEPSAIITGLDPARLDQFGGFTTLDGQQVDLVDGAVVISEDLAKATGAAEGDTLAFFHQNQPHTVTVAGVVSGSILTGYESGSSQAGPAQTPANRLVGMAMPLATLQQITGLEDQVRFIAVTNIGGVHTGLDRSDAATASLEQALATIDGDAGVTPLKADSVEAAEMLGNLFMTFFVILGMFSISAGILLIFLIFMMLAAERRAEMGMARAVGMKQGDLIQGFIVEGAVYALGAGLIGALMGIGAASLMTTLIDAISGDNVSLSPSFTWQSLGLAYALGVTITFITVIFASVRSSRLNIVAAIRDLPEEQAGDRGERPRWRWFVTPRFAQSGIAAVVLGTIATVITFLPRLVIWLARSLAWVVGWGPIIATAGALLTVLGVVITDMFTFSTGLTLLVFGLALFLSKRLPARAVYTVAATLLLLYWLLPMDITQRVLPDVGEGGPQMAFVAGASMVAAATLIVMWNASLIVGLVSLFGRTFSRWLPAVKTAVAYPLASRGRTGMTVAMFSIVIFSLVMVRTMSANFAELLLSDDARAGWDISLVANPANPIDDLTASLTAGGVDANEIAGAGTVHSVTIENSQIRNVGTTDWKEYQINGFDTAFAQFTEAGFDARAPGYESDQAVWDALVIGERVAIIDANAFGDEFNSASLYTVPDGVENVDGAIPDFTVELRNPRTGVTESVPVIAIISSRASTLAGIFLPEAYFAEVYAEPDLTRIFMQMAPAASSSPADLARSIESALQSNGVQAASIQEQIEEQQASASSFFVMLQGFMGLGLLVGIAALGVISFRAVVERRQQIGMLRAIGYQRSMVAASFLLESLVVAGLGVLIGATLAIILTRNLMTSGEMGVTFDRFVIPWSTVAFFIATALVASALMTWIPARKASSVPIAEALRYE